MTDYAVAHTSDLLLAILTPLLAVLASASYHFIASTFKFRISIILFLLGFTRLTKHISAGHRLVFTVIDTPVHQLFHDALGQGTAHHTREQRVASWSIRHDKI